MHKLDYFGLALVVFDPAFTPTTGFPPLFAPLVRDGLRRILVEYGEVEDRLPCSGNVNDILYLKKYRLRIN
jgi:hypothetical protein